MVEQSPVSVPSSCLLKDPSHLPQRCEAKYISAIYIIQTTLYVIRTRLKSTLEGREGEMKLKMNNEKINQVYF